MGDTGNKAEQSSVAREAVPSNEDSKVPTTPAPKLESENRIRKKEKRNKREEARSANYGHHPSGKNEDGKGRSSAASKFDKAPVGASEVDDGFTAGTSVELKTKISRLKGKLAKYSNKCNAANKSRSDCSAPPAERSHSQDGKRKPRAISERLASHQEPPPKRTTIRSMSFSASSTSSGMPSNDDCEPGSASRQPQQDGPLRKADKKRQRAWRTSINASIVDQRSRQHPIDAKDEFYLDSLAFFLLDLLVTPADQREKLIASEARNRGIILADSNGWRLNPKLVRWQGGPFRRPYMDLPTLLGDTPFAGSPFLAHVVEPRPVVTYEDHVNFVVHTGLSDAEKTAFTLPVAAVGKRNTNYFKDGEFESNLEEFAQKCVQAGLGVIVEADVRISVKNNDHAFIKVPDSERDAMISSQLLRKFALQGDVVRAFVRNVADDEATTEGPNCAPPTDVDSPPPPLDDSVEVPTEEPVAAAGKSCKAFVIKIVREVHNRLVVGNFLSYRKNAKYITFVPRDMRMPNVRIYQESWPESFQQGSLENVPDTLYVAEIISWQDEVCVGRIKQTIGKCGELDSENRAILLKNNLRFEPFDEKFIELYRGAYNIAEEEVARREDLRCECIFTIDPLTAKDLDDAMSIKELFDGSFEVAVHISDVTFFLDEDSELDQQVKKRTTSVYMVNEVFHMLPKPLCFRCSLLPGEDKLAFSVFWKISPSGEVLSTRFTRTVIRSCTQLAYQHAQLIIDNPERNFVEADFPQIHNEFTAADIVRCVRQLNALASILRTKRFENGALKIDRPKIYFDLDPESGAPVAFRKQEQLTANFLIEEFMLLANQSVAAFIHEKFPDISILRSHQPPLKNVLKRVKDQLLKAGLVLDVSSSKSIYDSLGRLVSRSENPESASICLSQLVSKPMTRAKYFCSHDVDSENFKHYALSIPIYTHFTSPIRRYPDVLVHRVLAAALAYAGAPKRTPVELKTLAESCNDDKYNAKLAGDDSSNLYFMHYILGKGSVVMLAVVVEIFTYSFDAILVETGTAISVNWKGHREVKVDVTKHSGVCKATLTYPSLHGKQVDLKLCSEVWLKITAKSKCLKGELVPPPKKEQKIIKPDVCDRKISEKESELCKVESSDPKRIAHNSELGDESDVSAKTTESSIELSDDDEVAVVAAVASGASKQDDLVQPPGASGQPPAIHDPEAKLDRLSICVSQSLELARLLRIHDSSIVPTDPQNTKRKKNAYKDDENVKFISMRRLSDCGDDDADIVIEAEEVLVVPSESIPENPVKAIASGPLSTAGSGRRC